MCVCDAVVSLSHGLIWSKVSNHDGWVGRELHGNRVSGGSVESAHCLQHILAASSGKLLLCSKRACSDMIHTCARIQCCCKCHTHPIIAPDWDFFSSIPVYELMKFLLGSNIQHTCWCPLCVCVFVRMCADVLFRSLVSVTTKTRDGAISDSCTVCTSNGNRLERTCV